MFKNQKNNNKSFDELSIIINKYYRNTIKVAHTIKTDLDQLDDTTADILMLSVVKLNNAIDDLYSKIYYYKFNKLMTFFQYVESLTLLGLSMEHIQWIKNLREYRNTLVHAVDTKEILKEVFSNKVKILKFIIIVEKVTTFTHNYYTNQPIMQMSA